KTAQGHIREIRPPLNTTTLSRDVIVAVIDSGWRPEGSIRGEIVLGTRPQALIVPEQAVVLRRAGTVVYVVAGDVVKEHVVKTGVAREGVIEILEGVQADATVVVDGAALLSDNAKIKVREPAP
ncbi:MAG: efflux RND transporter periplasmic adaptor subunit, partial [Pseudomonadota bacterium]